MQAGICNTDTDTVVEWIMLTKGHRTSVTMEPGQYGSHDSHYLLDMDLAILGSTPDSECFQPLIWGVHFFIEMLRQSYSESQHIDCQFLFVERYWSAYHPCLTRSCYTRAFFSGSLYISLFSVFSCNPWVSSLVFDH